MTASLIYLRWLDGCVESELTRGSQRRKMLQIHYVTQGGASPLLEQRGAQPYASTTEGTLATRAIVSLRSHAARKLEYFLCDLSLACLASGVRFALLFRRAFPERFSLEEPAGGLMQID